jgi:uncharacterized membrane protein YfcA
MEHFLILVFVGSVIGTAGTIIGAGGGFILMPLLLLLFPDDPPELLASISLAVVFFNALSGTIAYGRMKRIDYTSGVIFSAASVPGAILGALATSLIPRPVFNLIFGFLLVGSSLFLIVNPVKKNEHGRGTEGNVPAPKPVPKDYNMSAGVTLSVFVGFISSMLGIGGGIIHVPALIHILSFPVHSATATSHFILAIMSFTGTAVHIFEGVFSRGVIRTIALSIGALAGAQIGARLSNRVHGRWILSALAVALAFVGVRLILISL